MKCIVIGRSVDGSPVHQTIVAGSPAALEVASRWLGENPALVRVDVVELGSRAVLHSLTPGAGRIDRAG